MKCFHAAEDGFVLILSLLVLPVFLVFGLLLIDIGRGNNAQADLQAAADSVALAGARELDGGSDAITRAQNAMAQVTNSVSMLAHSGSDVHIGLTYENAAGNAFSVVFLDDIPENDTTPIDAAWISGHATTAGSEAEYVYVQAQSRNLDTVFFVDMLNPTQLSVPIGATAVATYIASICRIPPLYICNPFEYDSSGTYVGDQLQENFRRGDLHGRLLKLHPAGNQTAAPGNFGFLQVNGSSSADAIRDIFAGGDSRTCYDADTVTTKPGAATSIRQGINARFDIYEGPYGHYNPSSPNGFPMPPAMNVRKGYAPDLNGGSGTYDYCDITEGDDHFNPPTGLNGVDDGVYSFEDNSTMAAPNEGVPGAFIGSGDWGLQRYLEEIYLDTNGGELSATEVASVMASIPSAFPTLPAGSQGVPGPSRYDTYLYEQAAGSDPRSTTGMLIDLPSQAGELGRAQCMAGSTASEMAPVASDPVNNIDRRITYAAIIDCGEGAAEGGGVNTYNVNSYASIFLARPMKQNGSIDSTIDVEIIDITGWGGNGSLEGVMREEAVLVR
ncbi:pilus assembly protein TadG-related protein [Thalassovita aquimarina]|uniref:Putative Flp pilus-assembly TadG-like N-terminal domain-containing protein n=1 Tax=Thalassovita aquimarina TaxID=2785917 RepID=A0ABS5HN39_9RHOB|nr:pilus assembly protein TadG-related protein [Thalassovita aquimarina]MBR9650350.1 hypothetical protein [Thalassovita aquimarina]